MSWDLHEALEAEDRDNETYEVDAICVCGWEGIAEAYKGELTACPICDGEVLRAV